MEQSKSCITINCGCCGRENTSTSVFNYAQLEAKDQVLIQDQKVYFNTQPVGNLKMTEAGSVIVPAGTYHFYCNFQIDGNNSPATYSCLNFYDLTNEKILGVGCSRVSPAYSTRTSQNEASFLVKLEQDTELCLIGAYNAAGNPSADRIYATIIQLPVGMST